MLNPGELLKMQSEARKMQKKMRERKITGESRDGLLKIYMNGAQEFEDIQINEDMDIDGIKRRMKEAFKDYQKRLQKEMAQDMDLDSLKNMFN